MKISNIYQIYFEQKDNNLDKIANKLSKLTIEAVQEMLNLGKSTQRGIRGISRPAVHDLAGSINRSSDLGNVVADVGRLTDTATKHKGSIADTYSGLFDAASTTNPRSLLSQAKRKAYAPLGEGFHHPGSTLKEVANQEIENSIFSSLARQAHDPDVESFAQSLVASRGKNKSQLDFQVKQVIADFHTGKDSVLNIPKADGRSLALNVDRPIASYNGSPVINISKTHGIDGIDSFNKKHLDLENQFARKSNNGINAQDPVVVELGDKLQRSRDFNQHFGDKLRLMSSSPDAINKTRFTLNDLDSAEKVQAFMRSPHLSDSHKLLSNVEHNQVTDEIVGFVNANVQKYGNSPEVVKSALSSKLDAIARDPAKVNFMQGFQFERYSNEDMKKVMEAVKGTRKNLQDEYMRAGSDALGALGLAGLGGVGLYSAVKPQQQDSNLLHQGAERLYYNN